MAATAGIMCEDRARLIQEYKKATGDYLQATRRELERHRATSPTLDYEKLAQAVEEARWFAELAHRALQRHVADHGC